MKLRRFALLTSLALACAAHLVAAPSADDVVARARAYIGSERALKAVASLHYAGTIEVAYERDGAPQTTRGTIEMTFQQPSRERIVQTVGQLREIVGLDGDEGWRRIEDVADPTRSRVAVVALPELRRMQADTAESLLFFRGPAACGGRVEMRGQTSVEGREAHRLAFIYPGNIEFIRVFDAKTGRLLLTETQSGSTVREEGEIVVEGLRFPQRMINLGKNAEGTPITVTVTFEKIRVNEKFDPSLFALPLSGGN